METIERQYSILLDYEKAIQSEFNLKNFSEPFFEYHQRWTGCGERNPHPYP